MEHKKENKEKEKLQQEIKELKKKVDDNLAGWQRAQADYANFKAETEKRQKEVIEYANAAFMSEVLPVYNHFKLACVHIPKDQEDLDWVVGVRFIQKQFQDFLNKYKIAEIKTIGEKFDHNLHEAIAHEEAEGYETDVVFQEIQPGYTLSGKVLMAAKVKVAK